MHRDVNSSDETLVIGLTVILSHQTEVDRYSLKSCYQLWRAIWNFLVTNPTLWKGGGADDTSVVLFVPPSLCSLGFVTMKQFHPTRCYFCVGPKYKTRGRKSAHSTCKWKVDWNFCTGTACPVFCFKSSIYQNTFVIVFTWHMAQWRLIQQGTREVFLSHDRYQTVELILFITTTHARTRTRKINNFISLNQSWTRMISVWEKLPYYDTKTT